MCKDVNCSVIYKYKQEKQFKYLTIGRYLIHDVMENDVSVLMLFKYT